MRSAYGRSDERAHRRRSRNSGIADRISIGAGLPVVLAPFSLARIARPSISCV